MAGSIRRKLAKATPSNKVALFEVETLAAFEDVIDPNIRRAVAKLSASEQDELVDLASRALSRHQDGEAFVQRFAKLSGGKHHKLLERILVEEAELSGVPFLFQANLLGFNNVILDREFRQTLSRRDLQVLRTGQYKQQNALEWALDAERSIAAKAELERLFGPRYRHILRGLRNKKIITRLSPAQIAHYDMMVGRGIADYGTLASKNKRFGHLYEIDHLMEQRFWNNPDVASPLDVLRSSFAYTVPKDPQIAFLLQSGVSGGPRKIRYVHTEKTRLMRERIPHGKEHLFTTQQIWDAHIFTFESLGFEMSGVARKRLEDMFRIYVDGLRSGGRPGAKLPNFSSRPTLSQFSPGSGWPSV